MHRDAADEMSEMWLQLRVEFEKYDMSVDWTLYNSDEKYKAEVDQRRAWYIQQSQYYADQVITHNNAIGRNFSDTTLGVITNFSSMEQANIHYNAAEMDLWNQLMEKHNEVQENVDTTTKEVGMDYDKLEDTVRKEVGSMKAKNEELQTSIFDLYKNATTNLGNILTY